MDVGSEAITTRIKRLTSLLNESFVEKRNDANSSCLIARETLLDALLLLYDECNNEFLMKDPLIADFVDKYRSTILQIRDLCLSINDFETVKIICKGRFTEIVVAKERSNGNVCVLKKIRKLDILNFQEGIYFENERNLLLLSSNHDEAKKWVPRLFYSFQNMKYLYYVLEYCPGGNLCTMAEYYKKNVPEPMLRFYLAEIIQAINCIHLLGYVHRDVKPDNILLDASGHLKIIDFGSSAKMSKNGQVNSKLIVNIPHYTAPEIFKFQEIPTMKGYGCHCDWWSVGIVLFELITGSVPFTSDEIPKLYLSNNYSRKLQYGKNVTVSQELKSIISGLLQPVDKRFTYEKLIHLNYFNDIIWDRLHDRDPPFVPSLSSPEDTSYFSTFEIQKPTPKVEDFKLQRRFTGRNLPFLGFTYLWNELTNTTSETNYCFPSFFATPSVTVGDRRKTDHFNKEHGTWHLTEHQRHSTGITRNSEIISECSNDSFQSAASVRLENEVTQLHLFYNEKALIIEEKLKNQFHDMYSCLTEDQRKSLLEKEQMMKQFKEREESFSAEKEVLLNKQKELEIELNSVKEKLDEVTRSNENLKQMYDEETSKSKKSEKMKKDTINKLNMDIQKLSKELDEKSEKLKDCEGKLLSLSNQQAAKMALLNKNKITLRSKSAERDKYEQENLSLKNQLAEANKKITKLTADLEKKGKMKLDLEFRMTANKDNAESSSKSENNEVIVNQLRQKLLTKEEEFEKLVRDSAQIKKDCESRCQKLENTVEIVRDDYKKLKSDYDALYTSNLKTVARSQDVEKDLRELEEKYKKSFMKKDSKLEKSWTELNMKEKDIKELRQELKIAESNLRSTENEIRALREKLRNTEDESRKQCMEKNNILAEKMNEMKRKDDELRLLQEDVKRKEKREKTLENEIGKLKDQVTAKDKQLTDLSEQMGKMNEDLFANLVSIEELKTVIHEKSSKITICENEISNLKKELFEKSQQVVSIRSSLSDSDKEKKRLESKIESLLNEVKESNAIKKKEIEANRIDSKELLKQFESTVRDVLKENLGNKENKAPDFESMINTVQRKLSLISERPVLQENKNKRDADIPSSAAILEAQIERLESQLDKARENAVLQREAAAQAKKELAVVEKQLSDLKIDLRISQREAKTAEEQVKLLQKSKYEYYKELKEQKENLEIQLNENQAKLKHYEEEIAHLKHTLQSKDDDLNEKEAAVEAYLDEIHSLTKKNDEFRKEKSKLDAELNKKSKIINELKERMDQLKGETKEKEVNLDEVKKKENEWKTKYVNLEKTFSSVKETCVLLDKQVEHFENHSQSLTEKIEILRHEKMELSDKLKSAEEELKSARKLVNEEKSLKLFAENKIRLLESEISKKDDEEKLLLEDISYKTEQLSKAEERVRQLEDYITTANESMEKGSQYTEFMKKEINSLKHERSELLTNFHKLKEENAALRKELKEATDDLNDLQQANGELQSVLAQVERYHETRHLQDNTTLQQHSKLIEFLQNKYHDAAASRNKRTFADILFRSKGKENLYPKELENLLQMERSKSKGLAEQLYQAQIELMMLKGENISSKCSSPKMTSEYESCVSRSTSGKIQPTSLSNLSEADNLISARLKHNIPHKFETKLCTKTGCKCVACGQPISFGHKMSNCKECHVWSHVSCTIKVGPTCGLSSALIDQFSAMNKNPVQSCASIGSSVKSDIEGTIRVLRSKIWEKTVIIIQDKQLCLFDKSKSTSEPREQISFDTVLSVDDEKDGLLPALQNVTDLEKRCVFRIVFRTAEKTERVVYMLAASENDKINWMNVLRRNIPSSPRHVSFVKTKEDYFKGNIVCQFNNSDSLCVNQVLQLSPDLCLLAANEGLFSLKLKESGNTNQLFSPVKIAGMDKVMKMKLLTKLKFAIAICDENDVLKKCDLRMLVSNAEAAECASPYVLTSEVSNTVLSFKNCRLFDVSSCNRYLAVANSAYLMLLEWKDNGYDVMKYKRKISDVQCLLFTKESLLFSSANEYFCINLDTYTENKLNLFKCVYDSTLKLCEPEAIIKISADLYLVCDKLFGIFVNGEGKRIKSAETLKWPLPLKNIIYSKPFLCIAHENSMSLIYLPSSTENPEEKFKFIMINFSSPSILGTVKRPVRGIYLKEMDSIDHKIVFLDPIVFMRKNPKQSWSSISTHSGGETTDDDCIQQALNISDETDISLNSSILEDSDE